MFHCSTITAERYLTPEKINAGRNRGLDPNLSISHSYMHSSELCVYIQLRKEPNKNENGRTITSSSFGLSPAIEYLSGVQQIE